MYVGRLLEKIIFSCQPSHFSPCSAVPGATMTQTVKLIMIGTTCILIVLSRMQLVVCMQMRCQNQILL